MDDGDAVAVLQVPKPAAPGVSLGVRNVLVTAEVRHGQDVAAVTPIDSLNIGPGLLLGRLHQALSQLGVDGEAAPPAELRLLVGEPVLVLRLYVLHLVPEIHVATNAVVGVRPAVEVGHDPVPGVVLAAGPRPPDAVLLFLAQVGQILDVQDELDVGDGARVRDRGQSAVYVGERSQTTSSVGSSLDLVDDV